MYKRFLLQKTRKRCYQGDLAKDKKMIKPDSNMIDDVARLAGGAVGIANDIRQSIMGDIKERVEQTAANLDLIPRDEFERLELLVKTQADQISALEKEINILKKKK